MIDNSLTKSENEVYFEVYTQHYGVRDRAQIYSNQLFSWIESFIKTRLIWSGSLLHVHCPTAHTLLITTNNSITSPSTEWNVRIVQFVILMYLNDSGDSSVDGCLPVRKPSLVSEAWTEMTTAVDTDIMYFVLSGMSYLAKKSNMCDVVYCDCDSWIASALPFLWNINWPFSPI